MREENNKVIDITLPCLKPWQLDVYKTVTDPSHKGRKTIVKSKRQVGKSILAECLLITFALERKTTNLIIEPALHQSRRVFREIASMLQGSGAIKSANASILQMEMANGSIIDFKSAEQGDTLRGISISGILIIDEGAFIQDDIYNILFPMTDANNAPMLVLSTPLFKSGTFYDLYTNPNNISFDWSAYDTSEFLSETKLLEYQQSMSPLRFKSEYLGEFIDENGLLFINISDCIQKEEINSKPLYAGIDFGGGLGNDYTVVTLMDMDGNVTRMELTNTLSPMEQVEWIAEILNSSPSLTKVIAEKNSIGQVYLSALYKKVEHKSILKSFDTTNDSKRRIIENLATAINQRHISIPNIREVVSELQYYQVEKTPSGKITYNGMRGHHDDAVISLALALEASKTNKSIYNLSF